MFHVPNIHLDLPMYFLLNIVVYIWLYLSVFPWPIQLLYPLVSISLFSRSVNLFCFADRFIGIIILDSTYKQYCIIFVFIWLHNTREDSTHGHHQMVNTEIRLIIFFAAKDGEALYSQQKQDRELTVAQIINSLLPNSDLNWRK